MNRSKPTGARRKDVPPRGSDRVRYLRAFPGAWPNLTEYIEAEVSTWDEGWEARCHTSLPNEDREQWNTRKVFRTRDEAAAYAAAFVIVSEDLVAAIAAGGDPPMPHRTMRLACNEEIDWTPSVVAARAKLLAAESPRERGGARDELRDALRAAEDAWWRAHDFRDFLPPTTTLAPTTEEDDHDDRSDSAA